MTVEKNTTPIGISLIAQIKNYGVPIKGSFSLSPNQTQIQFKPCFTWFPSQIKEDQKIKIKKHKTLSHSAHGSWSDVFCMLF